LAEYVLAGFNGNERKRMDDLLGMCADAVELYLTEADVQRVLTSVNSASFSLKAS
jgi:peptidyl-tRNA hydrolase